MPDKMSLDAWWALFKAVILLFIGLAILLTVLVRWKRGDTNLTAGWWGIGLLILGLVILATVDAR